MLRPAESARLQRSIAAGIQASAASVASFLSSVVKALLSLKYWAQWPRFRVASHAERRRSCYFGPIGIYNGPTFALGAENCIKFFERSAEGTRPVESAVQFSSVALKASTDEFPWHSTEPRIKRYRPAATGRPGRRDFA